MRMALPAKPIGECTRGKKNTATCGTGVEDCWLWNAGESDGKATSRGWFWHSGETVKSAEKLFQMYMETVGRNSTLILNFPPNQAGVLPDADVKVLEELGKMMTTRLGTDLAKRQPLRQPLHAKREKTELMWHRI